MRPPYDVIVLAGGEARRLGGADKPALLVAGRSLLDHVLAAGAGARRCIAVGPARPTAYDVLWCREDPPGGGPVAGIAAGIARTTADLVVLLAADMPFVGPVVPALVAAAEGHDGAVLVDASGQDQPLAGAYRRDVLAARLAGCGAAGGRGVPVRRLVAGLDLARVPDPGGTATDCDTWADVERVRRLAVAAPESSEPGGG